MYLFILFHCLVMQAPLDHHHAEEYAPHDKHTSPEAHHSSKYCLETYEMHHFFSYNRSNGSTN